MDVLAIRTVVDFVRNIIAFKTVEEDERRDRVETDKSSNEICKYVKPPILGLQPRLGCFVKSCTEKPKPNNTDTTDNFLYEKKKTFHFSDIEI